MTLSRAYVSLTRRAFLAKSALAAGSLAGVSALLNACGSGSSGTPSNPVTINVLFGQGEIDPKHIQAFEKAHPNIKVKLSVYSPTLLNSMLAANNAPDVVRIDGVPQLPNFAARGIMLDLTDRFKASKVLNVSDLEPINDVYLWDGKTQGQGARYGSVKDWSMDIGLWYNKKLFDQAGVPYPDSTKPLSYQELLDLAKRVTVHKDGKITVYGLSPNWGWNTQGHLLQFLAQEGTTFFNNDLTRVDFTTPEVQKIFQWYVDWAQAHVGPSPLDPSSDWDGPLFASERLAMITYGYWFGGFINSQNNGLADRVGCAPAPQWGPKPFNASFDAVGFFIPKKSKHPDEAWTVAEYLFGNSPVTVERVKSGWGLPALKSMEGNLPETPAFEKQAKQIVQQQMASLGVLHFSPYISNDAMEAAIVKYIQPVMRKQASLADACKQLTNEVNQLLQQGKEQVG